MKWRRYLHCNLHFSLSGDLCTYGEKNKKVGTVYAAILHEATNGDQIIRHKLNQSISWGGNPDQNAKDSYIAVDLTALVSKNPSAKDTCIVKDMIANQTPATRHCALKSVKKVHIILFWIRHPTT